MNSVLMPKIAVDRLQEALGLVGERERHAGTTAGVTTVPTISCICQLSGGLGHERVRPARTQRHSPRRRRRAGRSRRRQLSGPRAQQNDVDETSEQCAEIHKHNAGPDCTRHPENGALDDRHCRCADSVRRQRRERAGALARHRVHAREDLPRGVVPAADRRTATTPRASIRSRVRRPVARSRRCSPRPASSR